MIWLLLGGWGKLGTDPLILPSPFCLLFGLEMCASIGAGRRRLVKQQECNLNISVSKFQWICLRIKCKIRFAPVSERSCAAEVRRVTGCVLTPSLALACDLPNSKHRPLSSLPQHVCIPACPCWTFQLVPPPQASCRWWLTLAEYHNLVTQGSVENTALSQFSIQVRTQSRKNIFPTVWGMLYNVSPWTPQRKCLFKYGKHCFLKR